MANVELIPFTKGGLEALQKELEDLKNIERPKVIEEIAEARSHGDLKENAEYHAARERQAFIEGRIADYEQKLSRAQVVDMSDASPDTIRFGAWVTLTDEESGEQKKYRIVGDLEADIDKNLLSISSPMAKALLGKGINDIVEIRAPKGTREYSVVEIHY